MAADLKRMEGKVVHGPEPGTSSGRNLPFFLEPNGLESIFHFFTGTGAGIPKSQINFTHERVFAVNCAVFNK